MYILITDEKSQHMSNAPQPVLAEKDFTYKAAWSAHWIGQSLLLTHKLIVALLHDTDAKRIVHVTFRILLRGIQTIQTMLSNRYAELEAPAAPPNTSFKANTMAPTLDNSIHLMARLVINIVFLLVIAAFTGRRSELF